MALKSTGQVSRLAQLPERDALGVVVSGDGRCFVATPHHLVAIDPDGQVLWTWNAPGPLAPALAIGAGGEVLAVVDGVLYVVA